jgi:hypothetical protein
VADDPYASFADPVAAPQSDPYAHLADPVPANDQTQNAAPEGSGFTDDQKQAILAYVPKAKDAADLERFSLEVSGGKSKIGNAQAVIDKRDKGATEFSWTAPTIDPSMAKQLDSNVLEKIRNGAGESILTALDTVAPGLGSFLRSHRDAGKAYTEHTANAVGFDYGPEIGGFLKTITSPSDYGDFSKSLDRNVAHERATMEGDSTDHPIASIAGELTGAGVDAALGNEAGVANLGSLGKAGVTTAEGALYGSGAAGPGNRAGGAVIGAGLGAATEAAAPFVAKFIAATKSGDTVAASQIAQAAHDLGIDLPKFVAGSEADAQKANALEQTIAGRRPISAATNKMLDQAEAARDTIAGKVGTAAEPAQLGDQVSAAANANVKAERQRVGRLYDNARTASAGSPVPAMDTKALLDQLIAQEKEVPGGTSILPILQRYADGIEANGGQLSVDGARGMRTDLRNRLTAEAGTTPSNADRLTNLVMGAVNSDMKNALPENAFGAFKQADAAWAKQRATEDDVLKPFLGRDFDNWGEQVAAKINADVKGNGTRLARFLSALPEEQANNVRASLISHLGTSADGAQNAAGDAFSLDKFLTNWNQIKGARNLIFPKDTVKALDKLSQVAEAVKVAGRTKNRSNTGTVMAYLTANAPLTLGVGETLLTHDPRGIALGLMFKGLSAVRQYGAAKLLASPAFARKLAATPLNPAGARAFWSRPWVKALGVKNPTIAAEIQAFQSAFLNSANDNSGLVSSAVASPDTNGGQQDQQ